MSELKLSIILTVALTGTGLVMSATMWISRINKYLNHPAYEKALLREDKREATARIALGILFIVVAAILTICSS